jgi:hypothetical protein
MNTGRNLPEGEASPPGFAGPEPDSGWVRLPGPPDAPGPGGLGAGGPEPGGAAAESIRVRSDGVRHVRRMSNLAAAALIVGTGAATVALAHHAFPVSAPVAAGAATTGVGGTAVTNGASGPQVSHPVATTSGSGVTVTTQSQTSNGQAVVTPAGQAAYHGS